MIKNILLMLLICLSIVVIYGVGYQNGHMGFYNDFCDGKFTFDCNGDNHYYANNLEKSKYSYSDVVSAEKIGMINGCYKTIENLNISENYYNCEKIR